MVVANVVNTLIPCVGAYIFFNLASECNQAMSITYDEVLHLVGAHAYWQPAEIRGFTWLLNAENGIFPQLWCGIPGVLRWIEPVKFPRLGETISSNAVRASLSRAFCYEMGNDLSSMLSAGRAMSVIPGCILVGLTYVGALRVHAGAHAPAFAAAAMTALCPALLSQALVTSDLWSAVGFFAVAVSYDSLLQSISRPSNNRCKQIEHGSALRRLAGARTAAALVRLLLSAAALALLCLCKMSCVLAAPIQIAILAVHVVHVTRAGRARPGEAPLPAAPGGPTDAPVPSAGPARHDGASAPRCGGGPSPVRFVALAAVLTAAQCGMALAAIWCAPPAAQTRAGSAPGGERRGTMETRRGEEEGEDGGGISGPR